VDNSSLWIVLQRMRLPIVVISLTYVIAMIGLLLIPGVDDNGNVYHLTIFDAFYFTTYTATTIGFGELPYALTHAQKIWVSISIYLTVLGWFYGIGTLVSLLQDKLFLSEIAIARFKKAVKNIKEDFVIVLGYSETTSEIIKKLIDANLRVVVIEKDQARADYLMLEGFIPIVPILVADVHQARALEYAGIKKRNCKYIVSLFKDNILNLRVTLASKILNQNIKVAVKATTVNERENLLDAGANIIINPFAIISYQIHMGLSSPSLFKLENWIYGIDTLESKTFKLPNQDIIICGFGRLGKNLNKVFTDHGIKPTIIEIDQDIYENAKLDGYNNIIYGNAEEKYILHKANIEKAQMLIIATQNDTINLSIISTVKKINKNIHIIVRENELSDFSIFQNAKINKIFIPSRILIYKTTNAIVSPLSDKLIRFFTNKDESWGQDILIKLIKQIGGSPLLFDLNITKDEAIQIYNYLKEDRTHKLTLDILFRSRKDRNQINNIIPLLIQRDKEDILMPNDKEELKIDDKILFALDHNAKDDLEYIVNNIYEFNYVMHDKERSKFFKSF